jgi:hypothetical protein
MAVGCAVIAVATRLLHPPAVFDVDRPEQRALQNATADVASARRLYADYIAMDSLLPRLPAQPSVYVEQSPRSADSTAWLVRLVNGELPKSRAMQARIGVFVVDPDFGTYGRNTFDNGYNADRIYYAGVDGRGPYCIVVQRLQAQTDSLGMRSTGLRFSERRYRDNIYRHKSNVLGPCVFWAKYGAPGPALGKWLGEGAARFASTPAAELWDRWPDVHTGDWWYTSTDYMWSLAGQACRAGDASRCVDAMSVPDDNDGGTLSLTALNSSEFYSNGSGSLIAHAESEFGPDRFATFWHSNDAPASAFEKAFGRPMGEWVRNVMQTYFQKITRTPRMSLFTVVTSLVTIAAFFYAGMRTMQARQVR